MGPVGGLIELPQRFRRNKNQAWCHQDGSCTLVEIDENSFRRGDSQQKRLVKGEPGISPRFFRCSREIRSWMVQGICFICLCEKMGSLQFGRFMNSSCLGMALGVTSWCFFCGSCRSEGCFIPDNATTCGLTRSRFCIGRFPASLCWSWPLRMPLFKLPRSRRALKSRTELVNCNSHKGDLCSMGEICLNTFPELLFGSGGGGVLVTIVNHGLSLRNMWGLLFFQASWANPRTSWAHIPKISKRGVDPMLISLMWTHLADTCSWGWCSNNVMPLAFVSYFCFTMNAESSRAEEGEHPCMVNTIGNTGQPKLLPSWELTRSNISFSHSALSSRWFSGFQALVGWMWTFPGSFW